jgi:hypothetical protein
VGGPIGLALAAAVLVSGLTACTGSSSNRDTPTPTGGTVASSSAPLPSQSSIANDPDARKDVKPAGCVATSSGWKASGTVTNPGATAATYTIVISFTTKQSTVLARGTTKVTVKAGATTTWTAAAGFAKTKGVQCVLRGVSKN